MTELKQLVQRWLEAHNAHDPDAAAALYAPDCEVREAGATLRGREQLGPYFRGFADAFSDGNIVILNVLESEDSVAIEACFTGTHTGPLRSPTGQVPPTGRRIDLPTCIVLRVRDGQIASHRGYFDQLDFMTQLGLMSAPSGA